MEQVVSDVSQKAQQCGNEPIHSEFLTQTLCSMLIAALRSDGVRLLRSAHSAPAVQQLLEVAAVHLLGLLLIHIPLRLSLYFFFLIQSSAIPVHAVPALTTSLRFCQS